MIEQIASLNDTFRTTTSTDNILFTRTVEEGGMRLMVKLRQAVRATEQFDTQERRQGMIAVDGSKYVWEIDYLDSSLPQFGSTDPSNDEKTMRILTIRLPDEE